MKWAFSKIVCKICSEHFTTQNFELQILQALFFFSWHYMSGACSCYCVFIGIDGFKNIVLIYA